MLKSLFFILNNHSGRENCRIIVGNRTCDVTVGELTSNAGNLKWFWFQLHSEF